MLAINYICHKEMKMSFHTNSYTIEEQWTLFRYILQHSELEKNNEINILNPTDLE
jgi:hypothetical protein